MPRAALSALPVRARGVGAKARLVGLLYLVIAIVAAFAEYYARDAVIVRGDAAATAANILRNQEMYRLGGVADLVVLLCDVAIAILLYELLRPVSRTLAMAAAAFRLSFVAIFGAAALLHFAPLALLANGAPPAGFGPAELQSLALLSLQLHSTAYSVALIFFGVQAVLLGILLHCSGFIPRLFGMLMAIAGIGYLLHSLSALLALPLPGSSAGLLLVASGLCELALVPWLLLAGIDAAKWEERALAADSPPARQM